MIAAIVSSTEQPDLAIIDGVRDVHDDGVVIEVVASANRRWRRGQSDAESPCSRQLLMKVKRRSVRCGSGSSKSSGCSSSRLASRPREGDASAVPAR